MPSLSDVPFLSGYLGQQAVNRTAGDDVLRQATGYMTLQGQAQQQQLQRSQMESEAAMRSAAQQAGGDIGKFRDALARMGRIKEVMAIDAEIRKTDQEKATAEHLRAQTQALQTPQPKPSHFVTTDQGQMPVDPVTGSPRGAAVPGTIPAPVKPQVRTRIDGDTQIQEELQPDGTYKEIGKGPRFARQVAPIVMGGGASGVIPAHLADVHGEDYLATLPVGLRANVKAIAEGRVTPQEVTGRSQDREALMQRVGQYDPSYSTNRHGIIKEFTTGAQAKNVTAINTALAHLGTTSELGAALQNQDLRQVNRLVNTIKNETGDTRVNDFNTAKQAVSNELMRVFRQVQASEAETKDWEKRFSEANSPAQIQSALKVAGVLLKGRVDAVNDQYDRGMNTKGGFPNMLSPRSAATLQRLGVDMGNAPAAAPAASGWSIRPK